MRPPSRTTAPLFSSINRSEEEEEEEECRLAAAYRPPLINYDYI